MSILNFGSINIDHVYRVPHRPAPGETLAVEQHSRQLGGKGANQSIAIARAGARVQHVGAVGADGEWALATLRQCGVDTHHVRRIDGATGHAVITVDPTGENSILVVAGANAQLDGEQVDTALQSSRWARWALLQNETNSVAEIATRCKRAGLNVAFNPAPFDADTTLTMLPQVDLLIVNRTEQEQLRQALGGLQPAVPALLVTEGAAGARLCTADGALRAAPYPVEARDTTGAGDTFIGYFLAGRCAGLCDRGALQRAAAAAALSVAVDGAAASIPDADQVERFIASRAPA